MAALKLTAFSGEQPRIIPRLMPAMAAQRAVGARLDDGALSPYRAPLSVFTIAFPDDPFDVGTIYKDGDDWLFFEGLVHFARGPVADERLYYTGDGVPKLKVGPDIFNLKVPRPVSAVTATLVGTGAGDIETRVYAFTYVTDFGEESEPSPLSHGVGWQAGEDVTLSGFPAVPGGRSIAKQRIYRSQTGSAGTDLYFIAERAAATGDFTDDIAVDQFAEPIPSKTFNPPPDTLAGLTALPNGMMAGFVGKRLYFSEPFIPHAWPEIYVVTVDFPIVGLSAAGTSLWVLTEGQPYLYSGTLPEAMSGEKVEVNFPCVNARSIVDLGYAVAYASNDGLVVARAGSVDIATRTIFSEKDWRKLVPVTMRAGQLNGRWIGSYTGVDDDDIAISGTLIIDLSGEQSFLVREPVNARSFHYDLPSGDLFLLDDADGVSIKQFDPPGGAREVLIWKSKEFVLPKPETMGCILIEADIAATAAEIAARQAEIDAATAANAALIAAGSIGGDLAALPIGLVTVAGDLLQAVPEALGSVLSVTLYGDKKQVATISKAGTVERLPSGFLARIWEVEVQTDRRINQITIAGSMDELKQTK